MPEYIDQEPGDDCYEWEPVEGSEEYCLVDQDEDFEDDMDVFEEIVEKIKACAPGIRWRVSHEGTDRVLCVPTHQLTEAHYVISKHTAGELRPDYCYADRYPQVFERSPDRTFKPRSNITQLHGLLSELISVVESGPETSNRQFLGSLRRILPAVYSSATTLSPVRNAAEHEVYGASVPTVDRSLEGIDEYYFALNPYEGRLEVGSLSSLLESICESVADFVEIFQDDDIDRQAAAVQDLYLGFCASPGWGQEVLVALYVVHSAIERLRSG